MELTQLRYFKKVAKTEHITKAAEELHITQPALSRTISRLEEQVGVRLFDRNNNKIRLNSFGYVFLKRVERAFSELDDGLKEVSDMYSLDKGKIVFSTSESCSSICSDSR